MKGLLILLATITGICLLGFVVTLPVCGFAFLVNGTNHLGFSMLFWLSLYSICLPFWFMCCLIETFLCFASR